MTPDALTFSDPALPVRLFAGRRAGVIGAGLGGLALAIRLQAAGIETVLIEARDRPGGRIDTLEHDGFRFECGAATVTDPAALAELWELTGHDLADEVELLPVAPFCRFKWPDGVHFDMGGDEAALLREIARIAPEDLPGYEDFARYAAAALEDRRGRLAGPRLRVLPALAQLAPVLARQQGWRSVQSLAASFVRHDKLRQVLAFDVLRRGGNPFHASALAAGDHALARQGGVFAVKGGMARLAEALAARFAQLGGTLRLHDPVRRVHTIGNRAHEIECQSGWRERFDAVASNADLVHTYRDLLAEAPRGAAMARRLARMDYAPGLFVVHFALEGSWPGIPHHMALMAARYETLLEDVFDHGVLPQDFLILLDHPTVTDRTLAPEGKSVFRAAVPVAHRGKLPIDWEQVGPLLEKRVLDEIGRRLIPDIHDRIITRFHHTPRDAALEYNAYLGSAWGLAPTRLQDFITRPASRDRTLANVYLTGAGAPPGAGVPGVLAGARATAQLMLEDLR